MLTIKSKTTRFVWTINGYLFLVLLLSALWQLLTDIDFTGFNSAEHERGLIVGNAADVVRNLDISVQHLEYDRPTHIANSPYYYSSVYVMDKDMPESVKDAISSAGDISRALIGAQINVLFFKEDRSEVHKLLEHNGYIHKIGTPPNRSDGFLQNYLIYHISLRDTNGDSRINQDDAMAYYLSDLSGKVLRQITPDSLQLSDYWFSSDYSEIYFEELIEDSLESIDGYQLQKRKLYYYNVESEQFGGFNALQDVFAEIEAEYSGGD